jgi:hypothetical protein
MEDGVSTCRTKLFAVRKEILSSKSKDIVDMCVIKPSMLARCDNLAYPSSTFTLLLKKGGEEVLKAVITSLILVFLLLVAGPLVLLLQNAVISKAARI